ncbi:PorT family protein [Weeksellaceae bacterium TAE3-ERU29]|nr:PorT family protein [Weeksellaceae bacterium TAE3-ERU29]
MRKIIAIFFLSLSSSVIFAQKHELGVFLGGANLISDIGKSDYVSPVPNILEGDNDIPLAVGVIYRYNLNPQQSLRVNLNYASVFGSNEYANNEYRKLLNKSYSNTILELSAIFEYNFFPINGEQESAHSPYIFAGLGLFGTYKDIYNFSKENNILKIDKDEEFKLNYSIPFGAGYKYKFNWNWIAGIEVGFRPTFIDYLDKGIVEEGDLYFTKGFDNEEKLNIIKKYKAEIGDNRKNDWYVFTGLTLTYTFGRPACFCD